jgi:hypothetical protein
MANFLSGFLDNLGSGLSRPKGNLGDFAHASRLFTDSRMRLAPKTKFLYHVVFNLNQVALAGTNFKEQHQNTVGMLVKAIELPKFKISVDTPQQYNRKRAVHTKLEYEPINVTFHDDNLGVTTALWSLYYGYYFADSAHGASSGASKSGGGIGAGIFNAATNLIGQSLPGIGGLLGLNGGAGSASGAVPPGYQKTAIYNKDLYRYGLDRESSYPFFNSIQIFQLAKKQYQCFTLVNPIITGWQHESLDNSNGQDTSANKMQIQYEAVIYGQGKVRTGTPRGFATEFYDKSPSPLTLLGGGKPNLFGEGGILGGIDDIIGGIADGTAFNSPGAILGTIVRGASVINGAKRLTSEGLRQEGARILSGAIQSATGIQVGGLPNLLFPKNSGRGSQQDLTAAVQTQITQGNGPLPPEKVTEFFAARPGTLNSLARTAVFGKSIGAGSLTDINSRWNSLSPAAQQQFEQITLEKVINGEPEVQSQYQLIKIQQG